MIVKTLFAAPRTDMSFLQRDAMAVMMMLLLKSLLEASTLIVAPQELLELLAFE
jgi:hypothetical protein